MGILSGEVGNLVAVTQSLCDTVAELAKAWDWKEHARPKRYVSVMLLGECLIVEGSTRVRSAVMLAETYFADGESDIVGEIESIMPVAQGAWLVVVGAPMLQYVRIGHDLQVGNVGCGSPVVRLRDAVQVGSKVQFVVSWKGKER